MGRVMLALYGTANQCRGIDRERSVIRLRSADRFPTETAGDFALVRSRDEIDRALAGRAKGIVAVEDRASACSDAAANTPLIVLPSQCSYLADGDIIAVQPGSRRFRTLYRRSSNHNSFLVTERCNHYCLMCSQPPKDIADQWILGEIKEALPLVDKGTRSLGFTGGEPLLDWREFTEMLAECRDILPATAIHVLSNGRAFAHDSVVAAWAQVEHPDLMVGIPIYSAIDYVHDYVVQARNAFDETVLGILKLKDKKQRVEIRVVLHAITAPRIVETCHWLARNLPFVDHVALMGLENTGFAIANAEQLWIDPIDYRDLLAEAVELVASAKMKVSVYNLPRCVLSRSTWPYAVQSISDWKNGYDAQCEHCVERERCSGFFTSGRPRRSRAIKAILA